MNVWNAVLEFTNQKVLHLTIREIIVAVCVVLMTIAFRKVFINIVMHYLKKITAKTKSTVDDKLLQAIEPPLRVLIITAGFMIGAKILHFNVSQGTFAGRIFRSIIICVFFWMLYRGAHILTDIISKMIKAADASLNDLLVPFLNNIVQTLIMIFAVTIIIKEWGYDIGTIIAGLGLGGLAFALAAQDTVANLFGGVTIMLDKPFSIGDWINTPDIEGVVEEIGFRSTRVRTFSQAIVTVPNSSLINTPVTNWSRMGKRRVKMNIGVTYSTTAKQVETCVEKLKDMIESCEGVDPDVIIVKFESFGDSALNIFICYFTKTIVYTEHLGIKEAINLKIMRLLEQEGVEIAFPTTSVYIENVTD